MKKVAFIIPGFMESTSKQGYHDIGKSFIDKGFDIKYIDIKWRHKTMSDYLHEFENIYNTSKGDFNVVLGFSFGAMIGYLTANKLTPNYLLLCSLSPYFAEDSMVETFEKYIGKKRAKDFKNHKFESYTNTFKGNIILFLGDKEIKEVKDRVEDAHMKLKGSKLIMIQNTDHNISRKNYIEAVTDEVEKRF